MDEILYDPLRCLLLVHPRRILENTEKTKKKKQFRKLGITICLFLGIETTSQRLAI